MQRCKAEPVAPSSGGETSLIMTAAGARQVSLKAKPSSRAAKDCWYSGASRLRAMRGDAAMLAPAPCQPFLISPCVAHHRLETITGDAAMLHPAAAVQHL